MADGMLSVGLDVGTTTTQMILSELRIENRSPGFSVPEMKITGRKILYRSPVYTTPLKGHNLVDGEALRRLLEKEYENAGVRPEQIRTGAVIITGETSRKENAGEVLEALSENSGDFVVATAGPDLESVLAAKGAGAAEFSARTGKAVLHIDIGGGTSNFALLEEGKAVQTGCMNVGGRLLKMDRAGEITYISPVLKDVFPLSLGDRPTRQEIKALAKVLCNALEMAAGLLPPTPLMDRFMTREVKEPWKIPDKQVVLSFSGGVADCIEKNHPFLSFGDMGPELGQAIRESTLCAGEYILGAETIRATVIGAGCHSTQLSGSTVYRHQIPLPRKNLPVISFTEAQQASPAFSQLIRRELEKTDSPEAVLAMPGYFNPSYHQVAALADTILQGIRQDFVYICLRQDMAKALGQAIRIRRPELPCLCLDGLDFAPESYLDIGTPVGPCFPVIIKTLILEKP